MSTSQNQLVQKDLERFFKALMHLEYSFKKVSLLSTDVSQLDDEQLEIWESFAVRFARAADLLFGRLIRSLILLDDPGFSGSFRDFLNRADKLKIIQHVDICLKIRALRNVVVHEYHDEDLSLFYRELITLCPYLLSLKQTLRAKYATQ